MALGGWGMECTLLEQELSKAQGLGERVLWA